MYTKWLLPVLLSGACLLLGCPSSSTLANVELGIFYAPADPLPPPSDVLNIEGRVEAFGEITRIMGKLGIYSGPVPSLPSEFESDAGLIEKIEFDQVVSSGDRSWTGSFAPAPLAGDAYHIRLYATYFIRENVEQGSQLIAEPLVISECGPRVHAGTPLGGIGSGSQTRLVMPDAGEAAPYSEPLPILGGVPPFTLIANPSFIRLPSGLSLNAATLTIEGTPVFAPGTSIFKLYEFPLTVEDSCPTGSRRTTFAVELAFVDTFVCAPAPMLGELETSSAIAGLPFITTFGLTGGEGILSLARVPGEGRTFPAGLTLNENSPQISGTPTTAGTYNFRIRITDDCRPRRTSERDYTLTIQPVGTCPPLRLAPFTGGTATRNADYSASIEPTGGVAPYTVTIFDPLALPPGITFEASVNQLQGVPTTNGEFQIPVRVTDSCATGVQTHDQILTIVVADAVCTPFAISSGAAPAGTVGTPYSFTVTTSGGEGTPTILLDPGPTGIPGLLVSGAQITGTPTMTGEYNVHVTSYDHCSPPQIVEADLTIIISSP